ncbi:lysozyme family protein [Novosphingobium rosa]|uniref:tail tape measure protein n=1 Tax=Novosphingobium rosa TaxID=76978 RepID=UPI00083613AA|nr:tail tape measure protein [Novosphingobium rosa]
MATSRYTQSTSTASPTQSLMVEVRAVTQGFAQDLAAMRSSVDTSLVGGFTQAGGTLDSSLSNALKKGTSGFADLREAGISALAAIAAQATGVLSSSGSSAGITSLLSAVSGLPGRATGGPVSPGQAYLVGERGPEVFVPTAAGSIANTGNGGNRTMNVAINMSSNAGTDAPAALARSSRQIASALRRVMVQS